MRTMRIALLALGLLAFADPEPVAAAGFECDRRVAADEPAGVHDIRSVLPIGDALDDPTQLNQAIDTLRKQGVSRTLIVDNLIGAYCPVVAKNTALSDPQKVTRMQQFAGTITRLVYRVENETEIIFNVPFPPAVSDQIQAKAGAAKTTAEVWIADTIETTLKATP